MSDYAFANLTYFARYGIKQKAIDIFKDIKITHSQTLINSIGD